MEPNIYDEVEFAIDFICNLETPECPRPSGYTDITWCNHWREQRHRVLKTLERLKWSGVAEQA